MATTSVINTTALAIYVDGTKVAEATGGSITIEHSPRDITTKDSGGWTELLEGLRSWSGSVSGLHAYDSTLGPDELDNYLLARSSATVMYSTEVTGDTRYTGTAYFTSLSLDSPDKEDNATFSGEFQGSGALTAETVT